MPRICSKFGDWTIIGSEEEIKNVKSLWRTDRQTLFDFEPQKLNLILDALEIFCLAIILCLFIIKV
jgi:hypothetical protein